MTLRTWAADRALGLAVWLEGGAVERGAAKAWRASPRTGTRTSAAGSALPEASSRDWRPDRSRSSHTYSVKVPPLPVLPSAAPTAELLRRIADELDLGIVRHFAIDWPTESGGLCAVVAYPPIEGEA